MSDETTSTSQVIPGAGAFDTPRSKPAPDGTYDMKVASFEEKPSTKGDSINHNFRLTAAASVVRDADGNETLFMSEAGAKHFIATQKDKQLTNGGTRSVSAFARINFKPEWLSAENLPRIMQVFKQYTSLPYGKERDDFKNSHKDDVRAAIALSQINKAAKYLGLVDGDNVDWAAYPEQAKNLVDATVRVRVNQKDANDQTRTQANRALKSNPAGAIPFDEETARAEADFQYPKGV